MITLKNLNGEILSNIFAGKNKRIIFSGTQKCINDKFVPKESPRLNTCDNCIWAKETYPGSGIFNCTRI